MIEIYEASEEDIVRILEIEQESISPPWTHGALLSEIYRDDSFFAVAVGERKAGLRNPEPGIEDILGFVILRRAADEGELFQIAVDKAERARGIANILMTAALEYADNNALNSVYLEVRKGNGAAIALYQKHGFTSVRQRKDYYSSPVEDAVIMRR